MWCNHIHVRLDGCICRLFVDNTTNIIHRKTLTHARIVCCYQADLNLCKPLIFFSARLSLYFYKKLTFFLHVSHILCLLVCFPYSPFPTNYSNRHTHITTWHTHNNGFIIPRFTFSLSSIFRHASYWISNRLLQNHTIVEMERKFGIRRLLSCI